MQPVQPGPTPALVQMTTNPTVAAGATPNLVAHDGKINLDSVAGGEDPTKAVLRLLEQETGQKPDTLKGFKLEKGFRSPEEKAQAKQPPIYSYSNPPGPLSYYFVRHWTVKYEDPTTGASMQMHFTKKIYTNIEIPKGLDAGQHKRQQYMAALAARTYCKVEEARISYGAGHNTSMYSSIESRVGEIAKNQFIQLEYFNGSKEIIANPEKNKDYKDDFVTSVRMHFAGSKADGETSSEGTELINLAQEILSASTTRADKLHGTGYIFTATSDSPPQARRLAATLRKDEIIRDIDDGVTPAQAFANAGVSSSEMQQIEHSRIKEETNKFYYSFALFGKASLINEHIARTTPGQELDQDRLNTIAQDKAPQGKFSEFFKGKKEQDPLRVLTKLKTSYALREANNLGTEELKDVTALVTAYSYILTEMKAQHQKLLNMEALAEKLGVGVVDSPELAAVRAKQMSDIELGLDSLKHFIEAPAQQTPSRSQDSGLNIIIPGLEHSSTDSEEDSDGIKLNPLSTTPPSTTPLPASPFSAAAQVNKPSTKPESSSSSSSESDSWS